MKHLFKNLATIVCLLLVITAPALGEQGVITHSTQVRATPVIDTAAYATGDQIGDETVEFANAFRLAGGFSGVIQSVYVLDKDAEGMDLDILFLTDDVSLATNPDNDPVDLTDATLIANIGCYVSVTTHKAFADNGLSFANGVGCPMKSVDTTLRAVIISRENGTFTSASDLTLQVNIIQD